MNAVGVRALMEDQLRLSRRLQARIDELQRARRAPMAVVGMGLRLPGGLSTPDQYWDFLRGSGTAVSEIPEDRPGLRAVHHPVPGKPGRSYVDRAAFLADIAHFDAEFFGISRREAELLDPQQRMLLETSWEAMERAGIAAKRTDRLNVGVFLGMMASEYSERLAVRTDKTPIDPYFATGGGLCFGAGRISYALGYSGPVVSVDTACSSSLTALHLAMGALRNEECRYALVCGSNLLLSGNLMVSLSQSRALAPDGHSKSFLGSADGYGRGEGVGALALMRLADAESEGRPILAIIRGTAVNHDGAASGLTVPNGPAQQDVIRAALADAGVEAGEIGWVEAHGTGTVLGDPIEVGALDGAIGAAVRERGVPLGIGSVKSRLGHLEAASGIAGLMKVVLMLHHGEIPAAATEDDGELNPHIPWADLAFTVPRRNAPWPVALPRKVAGVNSFGMSGTNAHAVLESYEPGPIMPPDEPGPELLTLSAKDPAALADLAKAVADRLLKSTPEETSSICHTLRTGRVHLAHRLAVVGTGAGEIAELLGRAIERPELFRSPVTRVLEPSIRVTDEPAARLGIAELTAAFGQFMTPPARSSAAPDEALQALLESLGLRVRRATAANSGVNADGGADPAVLRWRVDGEADAQLGSLLATSPGRSMSRFLGVLARLFAGGAELNLAPLRAPGARLIGDLPTYPFRRQRFWIDELPTRQHDLRPAAGSAGIPQAAVLGATELGGTNRESIAEGLVAELRDALRATGELDMSRSFLEIGGDSFISALYMTKIEDRYEIALTPDDLPIDLPLSQLIERLTGHIVGDVEGVPQCQT
jgi:acyl transferase domain-containing protein